MTTETTISRKAKDSWWPVILYFPVLILCAVILTIPVVALYPEVFENKTIYDQKLDEQFAFQIVLQTIYLVSALVASHSAVSLEERSLTGSGFTLSIKNLLNGLAVGSATIILFATVAWILGIVQFSYSSFSIALIQSFLFHFLVSVSEEITIRGYLLFKLKRKLSNYAALVITSLLFGAMHLANDYVTWVGIVNITFSGFLMGMMVLQTNSLSIAVGIHWAWNFVQGAVFGFGVSGHQQQGVFTATSTSSSILSGGSFGAEGSVLLLPITLIIIIIMAWRKISVKADRIL